MVYVGADERPGEMTKSAAKRFKPMGAQDGGKAEIERGLMSIENAFHFCCHHFFSFSRQCMFF